MDAPNHTNEKVKRRISVHQRPNPTPEWTLQADNEVLMTLPEQKTSKTIWRRILPPFFAISVAISIFACLSLAVVGWVWWQYGTPKVAMALFSGQVLVIEPELFAVGSIAMGEERFLEIELFNMTGRPIEVYGFQAYCAKDGCVSSDFEYPVVLASHSSRKFPIRYSGPKDRSDSFRLVTEFYTEAGSREFVITGLTHPYVENVQLSLAN